MPPRVSLLAFHLALPAAPATPGDEAWGPWVCLGGDWTAPGVRAWWGGMAEAGSALGLMDFAPAGDPTPAAGWAVGPSREPTPPPPTHPAQLGQDLHDCPLFPRAAPPPPESLTASQRTARLAELAVLMRIKAEHALRLLMERPVDLAGVGFWGETVHAGELFPGGATEARGFMAQALSLAAWLTRELRPGRAVVLGQGPGGAWLAEGAAGDGRERPGGAATTEDFFVGLDLSPRADPAETGPVLS